MKKLLSLMLACAMCLGLCVTAFAESPISVDDGVKPIVVDFEYAESNEPLSYVAIDPTESFVSEGSSDGYCAIKHGTEITVTNTIQNSDAYIYVYFQKFEMQTSHELISVLEEDEFGQFAKEAERDYYGRYVCNRDMFYLCTEASPYGDTVPTLNGLHWWDNTNYLYDPMEVPVKHLNAGESMTFTLPEDDGDVIYKMFVRMTYPEYDHSFWRYYHIKVDDTLASTTPEEAPAAPAFTDVAADSPYAPAIAWAVEKNITTGKTATTFAPKETCNTAQILTFLWRAKGEPAAAGANPFTDVTSADAYYYTAALWAAENGLVSGGTFGEKTPCTRAAVVTYLWKLAGSPEVEVSSAFTDVAADADCAQAVAWAVENKITTGTSATTFGPGETCTRGQIVTFLYRAYAE